MKKLPPRHVHSFLRWFCREDFLDEVEGDLLELFQREEKVSHRQARKKFVIRVLWHLRPEYMKIFHQIHKPNSTNHIAMLNKHLAFALRNIKKKASFSVINILGLAMGLSACLIILHYIDFETSYDKFNENAESIYRIHRTIIRSGQTVADATKVVVTTHGLGPALASELPEVKRFVRTHGDQSVVTYQRESASLKAFHESNILAVDSGFFRAFTFKKIAGNLTTALDRPNTVVLTKTVAQKYFNNENPLGKTISLAGGRLKGDFVVMAVMEDVPENSHFTFDILVPMHNMLLTNQYQNDNGWGTNNFTTYIQLDENSSWEMAEEKLAGFSQKQLDTQWKAYGIRMQLHMQRLRAIHLQPGLRVNVETVSLRSVYFLGLIAMLILLIAWINYINLSTARAMERAREVGIKKAIGATRRELMVQFFVESMLVNLIAVVLSVFLSALLLPVMGQIIDKELTLAIYDLRLWFVLLCLFVLGALASGIYPAFILSSFKTTQVLKGQQQSVRGLSLRKALVMFQFASSLVLITGTFVVYRQINFMQSLDKGLQMEQMLIVKAPGTLSWDAAKQKVKIFKEEVKKLTNVEAVATSGSIPGAGADWGADVRKIGAPLSDIKLGMVVYVDPDFIPTYDIPFVAGGNFDPKLQSSMRSVIINEASLNAYELGSASEAIGQKLVLESDTATIIGVLKNYNWTSLKSEFTPYLFLAGDVIPRNMSLKLKGNTIPESVEAIGKLYTNLIEGEPYEYYFLDDAFNNQYKGDRQFGNIFAVFASLAVTISCLGLWGLALFTTAQKLKEIGIRKVLGASIGNIVYQLTGRFIKLILISAFVALPLAWFGMKKWLDGFAFNVGIHLDLLVLPLLILLLIALITVSVQVLKGAIANPAKVLRSE